MIFLTRNYYKMKNKYLLLAVSLLFSNVISAQLSGTITVPAVPNFPTLKAVVDSLNLYGLSGPLTVNMTTGETAPGGGYVLGTASSKLNSGANSANAARTITINGRGNTITANAGNSTLDGIFTIAGVDYVTIDSLHLNDPNTSSALEAMEWGYGILKHSGTLPYDGAQHITIRNCNITLNTTSADVTGIYMNNHTASNLTALSGTNAALSDANRSNNFTGNNITRTSRGIFMGGLTGNFILDNNNIVTGNVITVGGTNIPAVGIYSGLDSSVLIVNNNITTATGHAALFTGIDIKEGKGNVHINNNILRLSTSSSSGNYYGINIPNTRTGGANGVLSISNNTITDWNMPAINAGQQHIIYNVGSFDSIKISGNTIRNISIGSDPGSFQMNAASIIFNRATSAPKWTEILNNAVYNVTKLGSGTMSLLNNQINFFGTTTGTHTISNNKIVKVSSSAAIDGINIYPGDGHKSVVEHNKLDSVTITQGSGAFRGYYQNTTPSAISMDMAYDTLSNITTVSGSLNAYTVSFPGNTSFHHCYFNNLKTTTGRINGYYYNGSSNATVHNNIFSNFSITGASGSLYGIFVETGASVTLSIYNNIISGMSVSNTYSGTNIFGMSLNGGVNRIYHNTISIPQQNTSGANLGASGIFYWAFASLIDLRNNIVNVNVTPKGTGVTTALQRSATSGSTAPTNLALTTNGNVYYAPNVANSHLYGEGTSIPLANSYQADPALINTGCGTYKAFMAPRESRSFTENNLAAGTLPNTWAPTGSSFAKGIGVPTFNPQVFTDYAGNIRPQQPDAGALEFTGTATGAAGPLISYTPLPLLAFCLNTGPVLTATISGPNPVNTTANLAPRLYYRKVSEKDTFGVYPGNNVSSFNGWKYVTATGTAPNFSFAINYSLLTAAPAVGESIVYFLIAQDNNSTPNIAINTAGFAPGFCATSVNLPPAAGPVQAAPALQVYELIPTEFTTLSLNGNVCAGATNTLRLEPHPAGATIQWQHDNNTGTFSDIPNATGETYITPAMDTNNNYRAVLTLCNATVQSDPVHVNVTIPRVTDTMPASHCGAASLTLGATGSAGTVLKWYNVPAGGVPLDTGVTFVTPVINTTTTYYVSALNGNGGETMPSPVGDTRTPSGTWGTYSSYGQYFSVNSEATINSVKTYLAQSNPGTVFVNAWITDEINTGSPAIQGTQVSFFVDTTMREFTIPVNVTLPVGRYKMTLSTSLGNITSLYTTQGNYPYHSLSGAITITGGGGANPNLADYYFLYNWAINAGCESPRTPVTATIDTVTALITAPSGPAAICADDSVTLFASSNIGYTYQWQQNNTDISNAHDALYTTRTGGDYRVIVSSGTCTDTSDAVTITVNPLPVPVITASGANNENLSTGSFSSYQWYRGSIELNGATNQTYTATEGGDHTVRVTDANGCSAVSAPQSVTLNVGSVADIADISVYPNPATDEVHIRSSVPVTAAISSVDGKVIWQQESVKRMSVRHLTPGMYLIRLSDASGRLLYMNKLIIK